MVTVGRKNVSQASTTQSATTADTVQVQSESSHIGLSKAKQTAKNLNPLPRVAKFFNARIPFGNIDLQQQQFIKGTFTYKQLKFITRNFHIDNKIGEGGFGQVYKGVLPNGTMIAVKRLSSKSKQASKQFMNEVGMISAVSHPHLVELLGCCNENNQFLLVYEYMENNSLSNALFGSWNLKSKLRWEDRYHICLGVAKGLTYLHEESRLKFIHRDIKPSNILLDKDLNAKISDFGLAKYNGGEDGKYDSTNIISKVAGTNGYMAPEYAMRGVLTTKADVYSFGVVMLELFSGKRSIGYSAKETVVLLDLAYVLQKKGKLLDLIDPDLVMVGYPRKTALMLLELAMLCTDPSPSPRPNMSEVVSILQGKSKMRSIKLPARYMHDFQKVNVLADAFISTHSGSQNSRDGTTNPLYTSGKGSAEKLNKPVQEPPLQLNDISDEGADVNDDEFISRAAEGRGNKDVGAELLVQENAPIRNGSPESSNAGKSCRTNSFYSMDCVTSPTTVGVNKKSNKLEYVEPCFDEDGKLHIQCSEEDYETRCDEWKDSLIGFFVGDKTLPSSVDTVKIENLWGVKGDAVSVFSMKNGYFLFRFKHVEDKTNVLESGPWHIEHRPLVLQEWNWKLEFEHKADEIKTLPIWVKVYDLPLIFWSDSFFSKVGSSLGIPLYLDQKTKNKERLDYARICIEVNANKPLTESLAISFKGVQCEIKFKYDWKPLRCTTCCAFGHEESNCESKTKTRYFYSSVKRCMAQVIKFLGVDDLYI